LAHIIHRGAFVPTDEFAAALIQQLLLNQRLLDGRWLQRNIGYPKIARRILNRVLKRKKALRAVNNFLYIFIIGILDPSCRR
jgi:hypothetical protein